jgi:hypothetical protein
MREITTKIRERSWMDLRKKTAKKLFTSKITTERPGRIKMDETETSC